MSPKKKVTENKSFRKKAEKTLISEKKRLQVKGSSSDDISLKDINYLIHELQIHQIELEMQNAELRKAQIEIEDSRSNYVDLYDFSPVSYFTFDKDGLIIEINLTGASLLQTKRSLLIRKPFSFFIHGKYKDTLSQHLKKVIRTNKSQSCDIMLQLKAGSPTYIQRYVQLQSITKKGDKGGSDLIRTSISDITGRKKLEEKLKASEEKYRMLFTAEQDANVLVDAETQRIVDANDSALRLYGYSRKEILKLCKHDLSAEPEKSKIAIDDISELTDQLMHYHTRLHRKKDGTEFPVEISSGNFKLQDKKIVFAMIRDISDRKKSEAQLRHSQRLETVGQLASGVAHGFNNILSVIVNYSYVLLDEQNKEEQRHLVKEILASAANGARLTSDLLSFSRKQVLPSLPVKINEIIKKVGTLVSGIIGEHINIKTVLGDDDSTIIADSAQIEQVLINLAMNAHDAMPEGGTLTLETSKVEMDKDYITGHGYGEPGEYVLISITDTGVGMDEKTRERIFEPFYTTKDVGKGTGLGLSITYGIIKQHEGYINVFSKQDNGATFNIYLPLTKEKAKEEESQIYETLTKGTETILLAEDDAKLRIVTKQILEASGYRVIEAVDGKDTVEKFNENKEKIELLILDSVMPKKSGKKAYKEIKKISPDIKVLFISGYEKDTIAKNGVLNDGVKFMLKPVAPNELLKNIREILNG